MNPARCKHEHEISAAIERREERYRILKEDDRELELPDSWKMTALQAILCGEIQKNAEHREKEFKTYDELRSVVMKWAINRRSRRKEQDSTRWIATSPAAINKTIGGGIQSGRHQRNPRNPTSTLITQGKETEMEKEREKAKECNSEAKEE